MRCGIFLALGLVPALGCASAFSAPPEGAPFDGRWGVTLVCPQAPDGALPFTYEFAGDVRHAVLHAEHGRAGQPGWLSLDGYIRPDGAANLTARGLTGTVGYNINHAGRGVPYRYAVSAHFDSSGGSGNWVTTRTCDFTFGRP